MTYHCDLCAHPWPICLCKGAFTSDITTYGDKHRVILCWNCYGYQFEPLDIPAWKK